MTTISASVDPRSIVDLYKMSKRTGADHLALAKMFRDHIAEHRGCSQQSLSREITALAIPDPSATGKIIQITPGTIHHYTSILKLPSSLLDALVSGDLTFKEARGLADLPDPERYAQPFLNGRLSSVYIERYVSLAHDNPNYTPEMLVKLVNVVFLPPVPNGIVALKPLSEVQPYESAVARANDMRTRVLALAGELRGNGIEKLPRFERQRLQSDLRLLDAAVHGVMGAK